MGAIKQHHHCDEDRVFEMLFKVERMLVED